MNHYLPQDQGWMSTEDLDWLYKMASSLPKEMGYILEVGTWKGLSTSALTLAGDVICIDHFKGTEEQPEWTPQTDVLNTFIENMKNLNRSHKVIILRMDSENITILKGTKIRFAFVDACHKFDDVYRDLKNCWELLSPGGILAADDVVSNWEGPTKAINVMKTHHNIEFKKIENTKIAYAIKP